MRSADSAGPSSWGVIRFLKFQWVGFLGLMAISHASAGLSIGLVSCIVPDHPDSPSTTGATSGGGLLELDFGILWCGGYWALEALKAILPKFGCKGCQANGGAFHDHFLVIQFAKAICGSDRKLDRQCLSYSKDGEFNRLAGAVLFDNGG